jgi:hypothetical protein
MPDDHRTAMPQVTAVDDQFGTHTVNADGGGRTGRTRRTRRMSLSIPERRLPSVQQSRRRCSQVPASRSSFAGFRFPPDVITVAVRWYVRYALSYRDVEELLAQWGIEVDRSSLVHTLRDDLHGCDLGSSSETCHLHPDPGRRSES